MAQTPTDLGLHQLVDPWWIPCKEPTIARGALVKTYLPYIDTEPHVLELVGRDGPTEHSRASIAIRAFDYSNPPTAPKLPVAAMPLGSNEIYFAQRAKPRFAVVLSLAGSDPGEAPAAAPHQVAPCILVAPYFGLEKWDSKIAAAIECCEMAQYVADHLPIRAGRRSVLRFDQLHSLSVARRNLELCGYILSPEALEVFDEWFRWFITGDLDPDGVVATLRGLLAGK